MLEPRRRGRFAWVAATAVVVSLLEALSAVFVVVLLDLIVNVSGVPSLPVLGSLDELLPGVTPRGLVIGFCLAFVIVYSIRAVAFLTQQYVMARVSQGAGVEVSDRLLRAYLDAPYEFHLRRNSAESLRNVHDNVQAMIGGVVVPAATIVAETLLIVLMLGVLTVTQPAATALAVAILGIALGVSLFVVQPRLKRLGRRKQAGVRDAIQHLQQGLQGVREIKIAGCEAAFADAFTSARRRLARVEYLKAVLANVPRVTLETAFLLFIVIVFVVAQFGGSFAGLVPALGLFAYAGTRLQPSLQKVTVGLNSMRYASALVGELERDFATLRPATREVGAVRIDEAKALTFDREVRLEGISYQYPAGEVPALHEVSFAIVSGSSIGIAGPTGCGKSTLLDVLCGLLPPTEGRVTVDGRDISDRTRAWHLLIGAVHQRSFLADDTVRRNVALGIRDDDIDEDLLTRVVAAAELDPVIATLPFGLDTPLGEHGLRLSGGQRQRLALARALYRRPRLLILDEATSALDNDTESRVIRNIEQLWEGMAVVAVAHRMRTIMACDTVVFMRDGRLIDAGPYERLRATNRAFAQLAG